MAEKKKRVSLTLKQKVNAIREVENNSTKSKGKIAEDLKIPRTPYNEFRHSDRTRLNAFEILSHGSPNLQYDPTIHHGTIQRVPL